MDATMGNDSTDGRPRKGFHPTEAHRRKFYKNLAILLALFGVGALLYLVGVIKIMGL